ncbi:MAG: hypothetical protein ACE5NP_13680 [Anaerolineae bacterium]
MHCEQIFSQAGLGKEVHTEFEEYPEDFIEEAHRLATWMLDLADKYKERIFIRVIDPQSPLGFYKSLRHWVRKYPTFIIDGQEKYVGWGKEELEALLQARMASEA